MKMKIFFAACMMSLGFGASAGVPNDVVQACFGQCYTQFKWCMNNTNMFNRPLACYQNENRCRDNCRKTGEPDPF